MLQFYFVVVYKEYLFVVGFHIHTKSCQIFWTQTLLCCQIARFDLHASFIFHQGLVCFEFVKHLSFCFQKVNMRFFRKVIDEGDKVSCSTTRCGFHQSAHITMHKFQKLQSPNCFISRKRCLLMFAFNAKFTHMVQ